MNCTFCQNKLKVHRQTFDSETKRDKFSDYYCHDCKVDYTFFDDIGQIIDYRIHVSDYQIDINLTKGTCALKIEKCQNERNEFPYWELITELNTIPQNLTPQNALTKMKIYILFS